MKISLALSLLVFLAGVPTHAETDQIQFSNASEFRNRYPARSDGTRGGGNSALFNAYLIELRSRATRDEWIARFENIDWWKNEAGISNEVILAGLEKNPTKLLSKIEFFIDERCAGTQQKPIAEYSEESSLLCIPVNFSTEQLSDLWLKIAQKIIGPEMGLVLKGSPRAPDWQEQSIHTTKLLERKFNVSLTSSTLPTNLNCATPFDRNLNQIRRHPDGYFMVKLADQYEICR